jgi:hypothetical protein
VSDVHVVIPTHLPRYLEFVLIGLARQTLRAANIVVSCDTDDPAIGGVIETWAPRLGMDVWWVRRGHQGGERLCQVRNNGVRHLRDAMGVRNGRLLILDGDMLLADDAIELHASMGRGAELVYPYRVDVDATTTASLDAERVLSGAQRLEIDGRARAALSRRAKRYRRHRLLRALKLGPLHKPKLLGGHFSCALALYLELNGFDELYQGWGFKDDEFAYRAARRGARVRVAVEEIIGWHLFHETRQPGVPMRELPMGKRFAQRASLPVVAEHGVDRPLEQPEPVARLFSGR